MKNLNELNRMLELAGRPLLESTDDKIKELKTKLKNKMLSDCDIKAYEDELVKLEKEAVSESIDSEYEVGDTVKINGDMHTLSYDDDNDIWWATSNDGHEMEFYPGMEDADLNEWGNSVDSRYDDTGTISDQPDGEIVDNSLRRYLDAIPNKVSVQEQIKTCDMLKEYSEYKAK